nr:DNA-binding pseudobarrel domain-containing protein [Tanacetum cinerariifolium]
PHLEKEYPLNEEVKQMEDVKYGEFKRSAPFNESNGAKFRVGPSGYYTRTDNQPPYGEKRPSLEKLMHKHQKELARRSTEMKEWNVSSNNTDGLAAIIRPHLEKEYPLNEEVKQMEDVKYGEFKRSAPFNESNGAKFRVGPSGYYTRTDNQPPYGEKRPSLEKLMHKHQKELARRSTEMKEWFKKLQENVEINTKN